MTIFFDAPVEPDALTTFVRNVPLPDALTLSNLFPSVTNDSNTVDFAEIVRTNRTARYRSFDGRIHVSARDAGSEKRVRLLPLSSSLSMGEYERLQLEFARTGGTNQQALARSVYNDGQNLTREVQNRVEQAWGDVLADGKLTINEGGFQGEADFGVPVNQDTTVTAGWADTVNATVLEDVQAVVDTQIDNHGNRPATMLTSQKNIRLMLRNSGVIAAVHGTTAGRTRVTLNDLNDLLSSESLPTLRPAYDTRVDVDGVSTRTTPEDRVFFLPANVNDLGRMEFGVSATALELVDSNQSDLAFEDAPGIVGVVIKEGPPFRQYTFVDATAMPILADAKLLSILDVAP